MITIRRKRQCSTFSLVLATFKGDVLCMLLLPPQPSSTESEKEIESEEETRKDTNPRSNVSSPLFENGGVI